MKTIVGSAILTLVFAAAARAQTDGVERLSINVQASTMTSPGGEEPRVGGGADPGEPGTTVRHGFSLRTASSIAVVRIVRSSRYAFGAIDGFAFASRCRHRRTRSVLMPLNGSTPNSGRTSTLETLAYTSRVRGQSGRSSSHSHA